MGRRPNPLVVAFFERGAKLGDSSNRYRQTCKRCGEEFPKGRIDALTNHLLRKCPALTNDDRQLVLQTIQSTPVSEQASSQSLSLLPRQNVLLPDVSPRSFQQQQQQQHEQSALDTLAEVSRRHLDLSSHTKTRHSPDESRGKTLGEVIAEQALIAELSEHGYISRQPQDPQQPQSVATDTVDASPLVQTATAASHQLELVQALTAENNQNNPPLDPQLDEPNRFSFLPATRLDTLENSPDEMNMTWTPTNVRPQQPPSTNPSTNTSWNHSTPGFGLIQSTTKARKRGRFNEARRKQISDIRKQGACIRCRMLRKSCSGETPCNTCRNVESARLWKTKCLRTRLANVFGLWSAGLFQARAHQEISSAVGDLQGRATSGRIEARVFPGLEGCLELAANMLQRTIALNDLEQDPAMATDIAGDGSAIILLLDKEDTMDRGLEHYVDQILDLWIEKESSPFMRATLTTAREMIQTNDIEPATKAINTSDSLKSPRSCYTLQNQLLKNVIELWILTQLLALPDQHRWTLQYSPNPDPDGRQSNRAQPDENATEKSPSISDSEPISPSSPTYKSITTQLQAAIEQRSSKLSRTILNELERRLLQRQQISRFTTFLSAVILLACVERMTGLYRTFDPTPATTSTLDADVDMNGEDVSLDTSSGQATAASEDALLEPSQIGGDWPLTKPPSAFWPQGPHFAHLLSMLLRVRALPPKTGVTAGGKLVAAPSIHHPSDFDATASTQFTSPQRQQRQMLDKEGTSREEHLDEAAAWLDPLELNVEELVARRDEILPGREEGVEGWDMRFVALLLLGEGPG